LCAVLKTPEIFLAFLGLLPSRLKFLSGMEALRFTKGIIVDYSSTPPFSKKNLKISLYCDFSMAKLYGEIVTSDGFLKTLPPL
jgi:hypothetical protein